MDRKESENELRQGENVTTLKNETINLEASYL
jgi:hypothetical protein